VVILLAVVVACLADAPGGGVPAHVDERGDLGRFTDAELVVLEKVNRADRNHLERMKSIVIPDNLWLDMWEYSPLPRALPCSSTVPKFIVVHLPSQAFAAYEFGEMVRWGPISSGRQRSPTPAGSFDLTWRSRARHSTEDPDWYMEWYFNFHNVRGLAFHQYSLPGRPASHGCIRLLERDAMWLYEWGESWIVSEDGAEVQARGTPVHVIGEYDHASAQPWMAAAASGSLMTVNLAEEFCTGEALEGVPDTVSSRFSPRSVSIRR
jgi:hypothetical protein